MPVLWKGLQGTAEASDLGWEPGRNAPDEATFEVGGRPEAFSKVAVLRRDGEVAGWRYASRESGATVTVFND